MNKCYICKNKEGTLLVCPLCASTVICGVVQRNHPEFYKEDLTSLFDDRFIPQLNRIEEELIKIKTELRIKKIKRKK